MEDQNVWAYKPTLYGKALTVKRTLSQLTEVSGRSGSTVQVSPLCYGKVYQGTDWIFPNYQRLFERSNICGSFVWKGDPRMQPRDVAAFHRAEPGSDGNEAVELITIESIALIHEGGGTKPPSPIERGYADGLAKAKDRLVCC